MRRSVRSVLLMTWFAVLAVALGCGKKSSGSAAANTPAPVPVAATGGSGAQVFATHNCGKCHATEAGPKKMGPPLAGIGNKPDRTVDWIVAHIKNPQSHNPRSRMEAYEGKISDADLKALAEYLIALK